VTAAGQRLAHLADFGATRGVLAHLEGRERTPAARAGHHQRSLLLACATALALAPRRGV